MRCERHGRRLTLVFLPATSPELQPLDHLFRILRAHVPHNHHRTTLGMIEADAEAFLCCHDRRPNRILRMIASWFLKRSIRRVIHAA